MRGKVKTEFIPFQKQRITPAYAGKSHKNSRFLWSIKDHPRLCGEKVSQTATCVSG